MESRILGRTGVPLSVVSLGAEHLSGVDRATNREVVEAAVDGGMQLADLAFESKSGCEKIGYALRGLRSRLFLSGHLGATYLHGDYRRTRDVETCRAWMDTCLGILGTDHVDILMFHWVDDQDDFDRCFDVDGFLGLAFQLKKAGKARFFGLSTHVVPIAHQAIAGGLIDVLMFAVNPAHDLLPGASPQDDMWSTQGYERIASGEWPLSRDRLELYQACECQHIGLLAMKPYAGGLLLHDGVLSNWLKSKELGHPAGLALTPAQCLSYALSRPGVSSAVVGCINAAQVKDALRYGEATAAERDFSGINASELWKLQRRCTYCNHCLPCPEGIAIGDVLRRADVVASTSSTGERARPATSHPGSPASACTECGECEDRCPFGVPVIDRMREAASLLG